MSGRANARETGPARASSPAQSTLRREKAADDSLVRRSTTARDGGLAPAIVHRVLRSRGQPLDARTLDDFGGRFGRDFSRVRVHTDAQAVQSARAVGALAYTVGSDVVFDDGQYAPETSFGNHVLAHELTHTLQQDQRPIDVTGLRVGAPSGAAEREADEAANATTRGRTPHIAHHELQLSRWMPPMPVPGPVKQASLITGLDALIQQAEWKEIRKKVYPKESADGIQRAKERKAGTRKDLTGLGKISSLEHFARSIRDLRVKWGSLGTKDKRAKAVGQAANTELKNADVPPFVGVDTEALEIKGYFNPSAWTFVLSDDLVDSLLLPEAEAGDLANTALHESRHAEQQFLAARFAAGQGDNARKIGREQGIPRAIATEAVNKKMDAKTSPDAAALGAKMFQATVTDKETNAQISDDALASVAEMKKLRQSAEHALKRLRESDSPKNIARAEAMRDALKDQISEIKQRYTGYRNIPYEADAHEVGDAAEEAFKGWP